MAHCAKTCLTALKKNAWYLEEFVHAHNDLTHITREKAALL